MPAVFHEAIAQLDAEGKVLEQKLQQLRTFVRVAEQYGVPYKREISEDIRKTSQELQYTETACKALRSKAVSMEIRASKERAMNVQKRAPLPTKAPLRIASVQSLDLCGPRPGAPMYPQLSDDDDFGDMEQFERDVAAMLGEALPDAPPLAGPSGVEHHLQGVAAPSGGPPGQLAGASTDGQTAVEGQGKCPRALPPHLAQRLKEAVLEESDEE